jgi:hypothetical protein
MSGLVLLLALPALYWPQAADSAPVLKRAGIERLCVPPDSAAAWREAGFSVIPLSPADLASREKLPPPGIAGRAAVASPTRSPWVFASGWRFLRYPAGKYFYDLPAGKAALAAAEAFAYGADAVLKIDPADVESFGRMLAFLAQLPAVELPEIADLAVVDDGTPLVGEVMNLLVRRNLLFQVVRAPSPQLPINVRLGTPEYPQKEAADPSAFALKIRRQLTDEQRRLRIFGSDVVIGRLVGEADRARLHLLNYGGREIDSLRVRVRGAWAEGEALVPGPGRVPLDDCVASEGAAEFSLSGVPVYAVIELRGAQVTGAAPHASPGRASR